MDALDSSLEAVAKCIAALQGGREGEGEGEGRLGLEGVVDQLARSWEAHRTALSTFLSEGRERVGCGETASVNVADELRQEGMTEGVRGREEGGRAGERDVPSPPACPEGQTDLVREKSDFPSELGEVDNGKREMVESADKPNPPTTPTTTGIPGG